VSQGSDRPKPSSKPLVLVLSGPSGVGKDTVLAHLRERFPGMHYVVTATTRLPRLGEVDGRDHVFVNEAQFQEMLAKDELLEHAQVYGRWYGVPKAQVRQALARGQDVVARVDVQGAGSIRHQMPEAVLIFLEAPSLEELERRLRHRSTEGGQELALRLESARREMEQAAWFDHVVVNPTDDLERPVIRIMEILELERSQAASRKAENGTSLDPSGLAHRHAHRRSPPRA